MESSKSLSAILIDDDPAQAYLLARLAKQIDGLDLQLIHYSRLNRAWPDLVSGRASLAFLDQNLGGTETGLDILRGLRDAGFDGPIVMLTGSNDEGIAEQFLRYGADAYVHKDLLDKNSLSTAIRVALSVPHKLVPRILTEKAKQR